jgi:hypothetical protein
MKINRAFKRRENKPNQTQPVVSAVESTCSELACSELVEGVEPISKGTLAQSRQLLGGNYRRRKNR